MQHSLQLTAPLGFADVQRLLDVLFAVPGVRAVDASPGSTDVQVGFDGEATSVQEISRVAARAGYPERARAAAHGGCCGACGG